MAQEIYEQLRAAKHTNKVAQALTAASIKARAVIEGRSPALWMCGPAGVGKSHIVNEIARQYQARAIKPIGINARSERELMKALAKSRGVRPVIMEEANTIFRSDKCMDLLKVALDPSGDGRYTDTFVRAPIFVTTNRDLSNRKAFKELEDHADALFNRSEPIVIPDDRAELFTYTVHLALFSNLLKWTQWGQRKSVKASNAVKALDWFTANIGSIKTVGPRTLKIATDKFEEADLIGLSSAQLDASLSELLGPVQSRGAGQTFPWRQLFDLRIAETRAGREPPKCQLALPAPGSI